MAKFKDTVIFSKRVHHHLGVILLLGSTIFTHGSTNDEDLQKQYLGQVLTLRHSYSGKHLRFDASGKPAKAGTLGAWDLYGQLRVKAISVRGGVVHIEAQRLFLFFDPDSKQLRDIGSVTKGDGASRLFRMTEVDKWAAKNGKTEIEVESGMAQPETADLTRAMNAVFLAPGEVLAGVVPDFWKNYLEPKASMSPLPQGAGDVQPQIPVYRVGGKVTAPRLKYEPDPSYTDLARQVLYQGVTVLYITVGRDGVPQDIRIARPLGMGLDEEAISAVKTWRFVPATRDGDAVSVAINVEINFRLY